MQESSGWKPDWLGEMSSFFKKYRNMALYISLSNTLLRTKSRETGP